MKAPQIKDEPVAAEVPSQNATIEVRSTWVITKPDGVVKIETSESQTDIDKDKTTKPKVVAKVETSESEADVIAATALSRNGAKEGVESKHADENPKVDIAAKDDAAINGDVAAKTSESETNGVAAAEVLAASHSDADEPITADMENLKINSKFIAEAIEFEERARKLADDTKFEVTDEKQGPQPVTNQEAKELGIHYPDSTTKVEASDILADVGGTKTPVPSLDAVDKVILMQLKEAKENTTNTQSAPESAIEPEAAAGQDEVKEKKTTHNPDYDAAIENSKSQYRENLSAMSDDIDKGQSCDHFSDMCTVCEKPGVKACERCKVARYCGRECQVVDWSIHKKVCNDFVDGASEANRPSPEHRRILFFPTYSKEPQVVWALHKQEGKNRWVEFDHVDLRLFQRFIRKTAKDMAECRGNSVLNTMSKLQGRSIGHMLVVMHLNIAKPLPKPLGPTHLNKSINALAKPGIIRPWFGPIAVYVDGRKLGEPVVKFRDITPRDVYSVVCMMENSERTCVTDLDRFPGKVIAGLKINDVKTELNSAIGMEATFESVHVPLTPPKIVDHIVAMAFYLGLRWYIRPGCFTSNGEGGTVWEDGNLRYVACVARIDEMDGEMDDGKALTGYDPKFFYGPFIVSVIVLHGSGKPVDMHHLLAFNAYLDEVYIKKTVASKEGFKKFWAEYKAKAGGGVECVPSPYKWEKKNVVDRLGVYHPDFVTELVQLRIKEAWGHIINMLNGARVKSFRRAQRGA